MVLEEQPENTRWYYCVTHVTTKFKTRVENKEHQTKYGILQKFHQ